jgi:hypothetical protein
MMSLSCFQSVVWVSAPLNPHGEAKPYIFALSI